MDIETLKHTNEQLISTLDEVAHIQEEAGRSAGRPSWNWAALRAS